MKTTSIENFRKNLKGYFEEVIQKNETLTINYEDEGAVVIMSLAEYNSTEATLHELSSVRNEQRLDLAIRTLMSS